MSGFIDGTVAQGLQAAGAQTLPRQKDHFEHVIPAMKNFCHWATINVRLQRPILVITPDHQTQFDWGAGRPETFSFVEIQLEFPIGGARHNAWIYIPHDSPHFSDSSLAEVITKKIEGLTYGSECRIHLARGHVQGSLIVV